MSKQYTTPGLLAELLDQHLPPGRSSLPPFVTDPLVTTAAGLARLKLPPLSPRAGTRIEGRLLLEFDQQRRHHRQRSAVRSLPQLIVAGRWALIASLLFILFAGALTPAVAASVPGEPFYPVKQFYERVELALAASPSAQVAVSLRHAGRRTQEALVLLERDHFDVGLIDAALADVDAASRLPNEVRASLQLRAELLQVQKLMSFVLNSARVDGLTTPSEIAQRVRRVQDLGRSELLLPLPAREHNPNAVTDIRTPTPTPALSPAPETQSALDLLDASPTCARGQSCFAPGQATLAALTPGCENGRSCLAPGQATADPLTATCENGKSCLSHGTPGATSTPRPTHAPPTRQPTHVPPPAQQSTHANNAGGNAGNQGNAGGNSSAAGDNSGGNGNAGGNGSSDKDNGKP